jgi:hypothetical protein
MSLGVRRAALRPAFRHNAVDSGANFERSHSAAHVENLIDEGSCREAEICERVGMMKQFDSTDGRRRSREERIVAATSDENRAP